MIKVGCPPADLTVWQDRLQRPYRECDEFRAAALLRITEMRPAIVFLSWLRDFEIVTDGTRRPVEEARTELGEALGRVINRVGEGAGRVIFLTDTPRHRDDPVACLPRTPNTSSRV